MSPAGLPFRASGRGEKARSRPPVPFCCRSTGKVPQEAPDSVRLRHENPSRDTFPSPVVSLRGGNHPSRKTPPRAVSTRRTFRFPNDTLFGVICPTRRVVVRQKSKRKGRGHVVKRRKGERKRRGRGETSRCANNVACRVALSGARTRARRGVQTGSPVGLPFRASGRGAKSPFGTAGPVLLSPNRKNSVRSARFRVITPRKTITRHISRTCRVAARRKSPLRHNAPACGFPHGGRFDSRMIPRSA